MHMTSNKSERRPPLSLQEEIEALETMNLPALRDRYLSIFKEPTSSHNGPYLRKRIAWRLQEIAEGGLSERAERRIRELAADAPIRRRGFGTLSPSGAATVAVETEPVTAGKRARDPRLPPPGTKLRKRFAGKEHIVAVAEDGFFYGGERFRSLSRIAHAIAGTTWNGFAFFGLTKPWEAA